MKVITFSLGLLLLSAMPVFAQKFNYIPQKGYVPDSTTAIKIAEAIWLPIYGEKIKKEKPFIAELKNGEVWTVTGTLYSEKGGVAYIEIRKSDCKILKLYHSK